MRYERGQVAQTIIESDKEVFDEKLNLFLKDIYGEPITKFHNIPGKFGITVIGRIDKQIPETKADEYELRGETHYCCECKHCEEKLLENGKPDKRYKWRDCVHSEKEVRATTPCCDFFYIMLEAGEDIFKNTKG